MDIETRETLMRLPTRQRWDRLASIILQSKTDLAEAKATLDMAQSWLIDEMNAQDPPAQQVSLDHFQVALKNSQTYTYDDEAMSELQGYLDPEQYDEVCTPVMTYKWNKVALNKLRKSGGVIARIIDRGVTVATKRTDVDVKVRD
jgi:hypothetical protein